MGETGNTGVMKKTGTVIQNRRLPGTGQPPCYVIYRFSPFVSMTSLYQ